MDWHPTKTRRVAQIEKRRCAYVNHEGPRYLPLTQFPTRQRSNGKPGKTYYDSYCLSCQKRKHKDRWASRTPEEKARLYAKNREWIRSLPPEEQQRIREEARDRTIMWRRRNGIKPKVVKEPERMLRREPLAKYLQGLIDSGRSASEIGNHVGCNSAVIHNLISGKCPSREKRFTTESVTLSFADKVMVALGGPLSVYDLYPELRS